MGSGELYRRLVPGKGQLSLVGRVSVVSVLGCCFRAARFAVSGV